MTLEQRVIELKKENEQIKLELEQIRNLLHVKRTKRNQKNLTERMKIRKQLLFGGKK